VGGIAYALLVRGDGRKNAQKGWFLWCFLVSSHGGVNGMLRCDVCRMTDEMNTYAGCGVLGKARPTIRSRRQLDSRDKRSVIHMQRE
jgi:hypothetical protein